ncbi:MAG: V-type ATP synthase subunit I [Patescibacteria group bacterium UBA2163]
MSLLAMQKIRLFVTRHDTERLMTLLHDFGGVEIIDNTQDDTLTPNELTRFEHRHASARVDEAVHFLLEYHKGSFFRGLFEGNRAYTTPSEIQTLAESYDPEPTLNEAHQLQRDRNALTKKENELNEREQELLEWKRLSYLLSDVVETRNVCTVPLRGAVYAFESLKTDLEKETSLVALDKVSETTYLAVAHKDVIDTVQNLAETYDLEIVRLPKTGKTAQEELNAIGATRAELRQESEHITQKATLLAEKELVTLKKWADYVFWNMQERDLAGTRPGTTFTQVVEAWVPTRFLPELERRLTDTLPESALETLELTEGEEPPVEVENSGFFNSFETITRLYGVPTHKDIDPTPFLAVFFFLFFGMSLSDVGYGAILMTLTGTVLLRYKIDRGMKQLLTMLFFGGVGSLLFGVLFGGYLGINPGAIHPALSVLQLFDPINNPLPVFYLALAFGFVQIVFGIILDIARTFKAKEPVRGLLDNVPWLAMFMVFLAFLLASVGIFAESVNTVIIAWWGKAAIAAAVAIMITRGRYGVNIFDKALKGVLALYGGVNYFSDLLSYSRLLALGLATGALAFSVNLIAGFIGGEELGIGTFFAVVIVILGHALNITLSTLGAFIHSARLQFVEFFGKFLTGTGRVFTRFSKKERNVIMLPDSPT